jgi:hypothetical protein
MEGLVNKEGTKLYKGYVWLNKETSKLEFDFDNPQKDNSIKQSETQGLIRGRQKNRMLLPMTCRKVILKRKMPEGGKCIKS